MGATWGLGHGSGVLALGLVAILLRQALPIEDIAGVAEWLVGLLLIGIGLWALHRGLRTWVHSHEHTHDARGPHRHFHVHVPGRLHTRAAHRTHSHAVLGVGFLHGAAGGGHLFGILPSLALPPVEAAVYLGCYLVSAVLAMSLFGHLLGRLSQRGGPRRMRLMMAGSGAAAMATGMVWLVVAWPWG
jgi:hypothetical protein